MRFSHPFLKKGWGQSVRLAVKSAYFLKTITNKLSFGEGFEDNSARKTATFWGGSSCISQLAGGIFFFFHVF